MNESKFTGIIICGDFNCPKIDWNCGSFSSCPFEEETFENNLLDFLDDSFLHQNVIEPTFQVSDECPKSILDLVITEDSARVYNIEHGPPLGTTKKGHLNLKWDFDLKPVNDTASKVFRKSYFEFKNGDFASFSNFINGIKWTEILSDLGLMRFLKNLFIFMILAVKILFRLKKNCQE